jgi:hypothetical protein
MGQVLHHLGAILGRGDELLIQGEGIVGDSRRELRLGGYGRRRRWLLGVDGSVDGRRRRWLLGVDGSVGGCRQYGGGDGESGSGHAETSGFDSASEMSGRTAQAKACGYPM